MIEDLIFRALVLSPIDYENYYDDPEEFLNSIVQIVQKDVKLKTKYD
jgi:hypothetical protein